ncbi:MAG: hypothetical protein NC121_12800 [Blautia sp.]|nr:hypothetical protein [Blautia sp.]
MRNKYIKIALNGNSEFRVNASISIPSLNIMDVNDVFVKIDTGCAYTSIPVQRLGISYENAQVCKQNDSDNNSIIKKISFGVNDSKEKRDKDKQLYANKKYMELTSITFEHDDLLLKLMDVDINTNSVRLSYDRTGNILIGMDILKDWDIHIGTIDTPTLPEYGQTIFLGCPRDQINGAYLLELERLFKTGTSINAALQK